MDAFTFVYQNENINTQDPAEKRSVVEEEVKEKPIPIKKSNRYSKLVRVNYQVD